MSCECDHHDAPSTPWWFKLLMFISVSISLFMVCVVLWAIIAVVNMYTRAH